MNISDIKSPADIKRLTPDELIPLAGQLRQTLLHKLSLCGGHAGPNLGFLEATIAIHYVFNAPDDKIVFDVSHQTYVHKMLTGRIRAFTEPEHYNDVTGYTAPDESPYDIFTVGHTSTSIALAAGLAKARDLAGQHHNVIAVIGDGSLSGGEAFEGLDYAATLASNFIIIVNDNQISIAENHGGLYSNLQLLRQTDGNAPQNYFRTLGFDYIYIKEGNDTTALINAFSKVKDISHPIVVHINTQKGQGYPPAEVQREQFHYTAPFDIPTGEPIRISRTENYADITARYLLRQIQSDPRITVITAGTPATIGFDQNLRQKAGKQFIDVAIAEQSAVAIASGLAKAGARPFFGVVSSFLQRAYDQLAQDVAINRTSPVFGIFYGTLYGMTDVTHLGWFDIAIVSNIPGIIYLAPTCKEEYLAMLAWAIKQQQYPVALRIPGTKVISTGRSYPSDYSHINTYTADHRGSQIAIIGAGTFYTIAADVHRRLADSGIDATLINPRYLSGIDKPLLDDLLRDHTITVTIEDGIIEGGLGQKIASYYGPTPMRVLNYGIAKQFADRYDPDTLAIENRLTAPQITDDILKLL